MHTSTNQFQKGCMTYWLTGLVSIELYCITQPKNNHFQFSNYKKTTKIPGLNLLFTVELIQSMWVWHAFDTTELYTC